MATDPTQQDRQVETISDAEWAQMQRDAMGDSYPGDEAMARERAEFQQEFEARTHAEVGAEATAPAQPVQEHPAAASASADHNVDWNAREWLNEAFKDDPGFKDLSADDMARLEALATQKHEELTGEINGWATEKGAEWSSGMKDAIREGMNDSGRLEGFYERYLEDGEFSEADKAAMEKAGEGMTPAEGAALGRPIMAELHEINGEVFDGVEMIVDHAVEDIHEIVEARAEMPGGDHESVQKLLHDLEEAPDKVHDALEWEREQADIQFEKIDDRLELIEAGTDPSDLPPDTDTYQVDDNADHYESEAA